MNARIAVIGTGYWGKNLLRNVDALGVLGAFCDSDAAARAAFAEQYPDATAYGAVSDVLADPSISAVMIATPAVTHGALVREALEAGKHVFVEKPLCLDLAEARTLTAFAEKRGLTLMVGHLMLYHPAFIALRDYVRSGAIGAVCYVYSNRASLGKIRIEENALWSFAPHDISMILNLLGGLPEKVQANGHGFVTQQLADVCLTSMTFADGVGAHIFVSWLNPYKDHKLVVVGSEGMIVFNDVEAGEDKLLAWHHQIKQSDRSAPPTVSRAESTPVAYDGDMEPLYNECASFLRCVEGGTAPPSDGAEGERVLSVLAAAQASMERGGEAVSCSWDTSPLPLRFSN
jgi:UDP-2-acetamido-3-amino-2,3-dideoxy-glucuronate N-acetyltransferase